ncbi:MAG: hypothetical protein K5662_08230 [Lachnospiraceae bacterium]|nr:hypothetical protein [Lachnospiraceae bacterium]
MLNEDKIRLMCRLASYENGEGRKVLPITGYYRSDYISLEMLKSLLAGTLAFAAVAGVFVFYHFEYIMENLYRTPWTAYIRKGVTVYAIFMGIYLIMTYVLAALRYKNAKKSLKRYYANLKKLWKTYTVEKN